MTEIAKAIRTGDVLSNILDTNSDEYVTYTKVLNYIDGTPMTDLKVDGTIYRKLLDEYFKRNYSGFINLEWFGAKGDGITDDTLAIQTAINVTSILCGTLYIGKGTWLIDSITLKSNITIVTEGFDTIIKQKPQSIVGIRAIVVNGSNIEIGDIAFIGNIATDINEQNHFLFINATSATGNITNITIGNVKGYDVRGDVVYVGARTPYTTTNIKIGEVYGDNIFRNVVSITGVDYLTLAKVTGDRVNILTLDIEPEPTNTPVSNVYVGYVKGRAANFAASSATNPILSVIVDKLLLSPTYQSISDYPYNSNTLVTPDAMVVRNVKNLRINEFLAFGFNRSAIFTITNVGESGVESLSIGYFKVYNCSITDTIYNTYINGSGMKSILINKLDIDLITGKTGMQSVGTVKINEVIANLALNCTLVRISTNVSIDKINLTGLGRPIADVNSGIVSNGVVNGSYLAYNSHNVTFINIIATVTNIFNANFVDNYPVNSTINGKFYALGFTKTSVIEIGDIDTKPSTLNSLYIEEGKLYNQSASLTRPGIVNTGAQIFGGAKKFAAKIIAALGIAIGTVINNNLTASDNSDILVNLDIDGAFVPGSFTGVETINLRAKGTTQLNADNSGAIYFGAKRQTKYGTGFEFRGSGAMYDPSSSSFGLRLGFDVNHNPLIQAYREDVGALDMSINGLGGRLGLGVSVPSSKAHFAAGSAGTGMSPAKFNSGVLNTVPEVGALEFLIDRLYFTKTTGTTREQLAYMSDIVGSLSVDSAVTAYSKGTINAAYPNANPNYSVVCPNINTVYIKYDATNWYTRAITLLA